MKMKKAAALVLSLALIALSALALTGCGKKLESIEITSAPAKVDYIEGQTFDPAGMKVSAVYSNGVKEEITEYTYSPDGALGVDDKVITVTYNEKTVTQAITVVSKKVDSIAVTTAATKTEYNEGETFDKTGLVVTATYNDGSTAEIKDYEVRPKRPLCINDINAVITYGDLTVMQEIKVTGPEKRAKTYPVYKTVGAVNVGGTEANIIFNFYNDYTVVGMLDSGDAMINGVLSKKLSFPGVWERDGEEFTLTLNSFTFDPKTFKDLAGFIPEDQPELKEMFDQLIAMDPIDIEGDRANVERKSDGSVSYKIKITAFGMPIELNGTGNGAPDKIEVKAGDAAEAEFGDYTKSVPSMSVSIIANNSSASNGTHLNYICNDGNVWKMTVNSAKEVKDAELAFRFKISKKATNDISEWVTLKVNGTEVALSGLLDDANYRDFKVNADLKAGDNVIELSWKLPLDDKGNPVKLTTFCFDYVSFSSDVTIINPSLGLVK